VPVSQSSKGSKKERQRVRRRVLAFAIAVASGTAVAMLPLAGGIAGAQGQILWVSASPTAGSGPSCTQASPCTLLGALNSANNGDTIEVESGTYYGGVIVDKTVNLVGVGDPVIDAATSINGVGIQITNAGSGSSVTGFTIENATYEGILVGTSPAAPNGSPVTSGQPVTNVSLQYNVVINNDRGFNPKGGPGECAFTPEAPGDCGEGIHLVSVMNSTVAYNVVVGNAGGILLTDEFGPNRNNVITNNYVANNESDCGITLAGHSPLAANSSGVPTGEAGVFNNVVRHNTVLNNGVLGQGGGILMAGGPGSAVYDNTIEANIAWNNGLAGVVIHDHAGGYFGGNIIEENWLANDNLTGDFDFPAKDPATTGIFIASIFPGGLAGTTIIGNVIANVSIGIFTYNAQQAYIAPNNLYLGVGTPVSQN